MKVFSVVALLAAAAHTASAHYIFHILQTPSGSTSAAIRQPSSNSPVESVTSSQMTCGLNPRPASETVSIAAGSSFTFKVDNGLGHPGPAAIYLGQVPSGQTAASWNGSGAQWFKIAEWGAKFNPFGFVVDGQRELSASIPSRVPSGEYLLRVEHLGLHVAGAPQWYISCAQIKVTNGGNGSPSKVSIPGYVSSNDPGITVNIHWPVPTSYKVPGPAVWS